MGIIKCVTTLTLLLCTYNVKAQEPAKYRITYDCEAESFVGKKETYRWTLDIGNESAVFYCRDYRNYNVELDSLINAMDATALLDKMALLGKKYAGRSSLQLLTGKPEKGMYTYVNGCGDSSLRYEESIPKIDWQLVDSTKNICGYDCNMAIGSVYGRTWIVWYSTEVPMMYGPYIFNGLPGLIMAAYDNGRIFNFEAIGIEQAPEDAIIELLGLEKAQKCTRKRFLVLRKESSELSLKERAERTRQHLGLDSKNMTVKVMNAEGKEVSGAESIPKRNYLDLE